MYHEKVTYNDYNGVERTEDVYFNLSEAELAEMELGTTGGLGEMITKLISTQDIPSILKIFKDLVLRSYGEKSPDGRRFIKNDELRTAFSQTEAYSKLFMKYAFDADAASKFVNGIIPANMHQNVQAMIESNDTTSSTDDDEETATETETVD